MRIFTHLTNKGYYSEAIEAGRLYEKAIGEGLCEGSALFYQELGYCLQKEERYKEAVDYYTRADIIKPDNVWTLQHIAQCVAKYLCWLSAIVVHVYLVLALYARAYF